MTLVEAIVPLKRLRWVLIVEYLALGTSNAVGWLCFLIEWTHRDGGDLSGILDTVVEWGFGAAFLGVATSVPVFAVQLLAFVWVFVLKRSKATALGCGWTLALLVLSLIALGGMIALGSMISAAPSGLRI